ncbi:MAG: DUF6702 family protein [Bacteroidota bacterium]
MKILLLFPLLFLLPQTEIPAAHEFHISRTRIEYGAAQQEWQITMHVFIDDLELALAEKGSSALYLGTKRESEEADHYIQRYLQQYFQLSSGDDTLEWQWLGKEISEDLTAFWIYLVVPEANPERPLGIRNKLLLDLYDDQQNMIQVAAEKGRTKSYLFHQDHWEQEVIFN